MPPPMLGPQAFYDFWTRIEPSLTHLQGEYPDGIKTALRAYYQVFGLELPPDLSLSTETQSASQGHIDVALVSARPLCVTQAIS